VLPVLITLVLGAADLGRLAEYDNIVSNAARVGAEYGATHRRTPLNADTWEQRLIAAVQEEAAHLPHFDGDLLQVTVDVTEHPERAPTIMVTVSYPFDAVVDWPGLPAGFDVQAEVGYEQYR
jgi:hypothetical protein